MFYNTFAFNIALGLVLLALFGASHADAGGCSLRMMPHGPDTDSLMHGVPVGLSDGRISLNRVPAAALAEYATVTGVDLRLFDSAPYTLLDDGELRVRDSDVLLPQVAVVYDARSGRLLSRCMFPLSASLVLQSAARADAEPFDFLSAVMAAYASADAGESVLAPDGSVYAQLTGDNTVSILPAPTLTPEERVDALGAMALLACHRADVVRFEHLGPADYSAVQAALLRIASLREHWRCPSSAVFVFDERTSRRYMPQMRGFENGRVGYDDLVRRARASSAKPTPGNITRIVRAVHSSKVAHARQLQVEAKEARFVPGAGCNGVVGSDLVTSPCGRCDAPADNAPATFARSTPYNLALGPLNVTVAPTHVGDFMRGVSAALALAEVSEDDLNATSVLYAELYDPVQDLVLTYGAAPVALAEYASEAMGLAHVAFVAPIASPSAVYEVRLGLSGVTSGSTIEVWLSAPGDANQTVVDGVAYGAHVFPIFGDPGEACNARPGGYTDQLLGRALLCGDNDPETCLCEHATKPVHLETRRVPGGLECVTTFGYITYGVPDSVPAFTVPRNTPQNHLCGCGDYTCGLSPARRPSATQCATVKERFVNTHGALAPPAEWWNVTWPCGAEAMAGEGTHLAWRLRDIRVETAAQAQAANRDTGAGNGLTRR